MSASASCEPCTAPPEVASPTTSSRIRCSWARCQLSRSDVAVMASAAAAIDAAQASSGLGSPKSSRQAWRRSTSSAKRPARSMSPLSTSSRGSTPPKSCWPSLGHGHAEQDPVQPGPPGVGLEPLELVRGAGAGRRGPIGPRCRTTHLLHPAEIVVVEPEPAPDRLAAGEIEHLGGRQPGGGQVEQLGRPRRGPGWSGAASGRPAGPAGRGVGPRPGRRRLVVVVDVAGAEGGVDERRERLDVGAHHDDVAGLEAGVLGEQVQDGVAEDLDLTGPAVAGVDLKAAVAGVEEVPGVRLRPTATPPEARGRRARRPGSGRAASMAAAQPRAMVVDRPPAGSAAASTSCISRASLPPRAEQQVARQRPRSGRRAAAPPGAGPGSPGDPVPERRRRVQQEEVDVALDRQRVKHVRDSWPGGGSGRTATAVGAGRPSFGSARRRTHASSSRSAGLGGRSAGAAAATAPPATGPGAVVAGRVPTTTGPRSAGAPAQARSISGRCTP